MSGPRYRSMSSRKVAHCTARARRGDVQCVDAPVGLGRPPGRTLGPNLRTRPGKHALGEALSSAPDMFFGFPPSCLGIS